MTYEGRVTLSYNKMFGTGTLLNAMGGANIQSSENNGNGYTAVGLYSDKLGHPFCDKVSGRCNSARKSRIGAFYGIIFEC